MVDDPQLEDELTGMLMSVAVLHNEGPVWRRESG
jgi:hypothetical protein